MREITIDEAVKAVGGSKQIAGAPKLTGISGVTMDSRLVKSGDLFVAIKGERVDGHDFMAEVFDKGAAAVLCDHVPENVKNGVCILVDNTVKALQDLAEWYRQSLDVKVVGISGSVGKTSTKEMVASVLSAGFSVLKTKGNYNNEIGLPLTVLSIEPENEVAVLEMGISDFGEMRLLARIARPDICVLTNIGQSHLEALGTRDGILKAKSEMFEYRNPDGPVFLNGDDDKLSHVKDINGTKPTFYGFSEGNHIHPENVESLGLAGTKMTICIGEDKFDASIKMIGNHMVANALVAAAIGNYLGMTNEQIREGLANADTIGGRSHLIPRGKGFVIDDCYNAAPTSMKAAVDTLCLATGRKVAILGDMFELGKDSDAMHYDMGVYAAGKPIDMLICVGENSRHMYEGALSKKPVFEVIYCHSLEDLLSKIDSFISADDNVLVKASNGMHFSEVVDRLK